MSIEAAIVILNMVIELSNQQGMKVSVALYDQNCHLAAFGRMPESYIGSINSAQEKGRSACYFQKNTKDFEDAVNGGRVGITKATDVVPISGGVVFFKNKKFAGAVGISGAKAAVDHDLGVKALKKLELL